MTTTERTRPPYVPDPDAPWSTARHPAALPRTEPPNIAEIPTMVGLVAVAGPPVVALAAINVVVAVVLYGPFLLILTSAAIIAVLTAATGALLGAPYLLARHLHRRGANHA